MFFWPIFVRFDTGERGCKRTLFRPVDRVRKILFCHFLAEKLKKTPFFLRFFRKVLLHLHIEWIDKFEKILKYIKILKLKHLW